MAQAPLLLALDLTGTFAFGLNGALTAVRVVRLDLVGVITLGMMTALGGGILRDILIGALPPATFNDAVYLGVAAAGALVAFFISVELERFTRLITLFDAVGLGVFCVTGASKALDYGLGGTQAVLLGALTAVGGGTLRDVAIKHVPSVLTSDFYAVPALVGAVLTVVAVRWEVYGIATALAAAAVCFAIRMLGVRYRLRVPSTPRRKVSDEKPALDARLSWQEEFLRNAGPRAEERLREFGFQVSDGVGVLENGAGPAVLLRAASGESADVACVLGAAQLLSEDTDRWRGTLLVQLHGEPDARPDVVLAHHVPDPTRAALSTGTESLVTAALSWL
ncbi:TRIC cation channel family protein [Saccharopolyspora sp. ID03-671]|uniref:TRIC cation channel family protein n=1 Tax=Saccharopolyspora sp. ID03-671 TaxID=3073066 RepID=UPI003244534C